MNAKKDIFITSILAGQSITAAAKEAGVSGTAAHNWLTKKGLQETIDQYRRELFTSNLNKLENALAGAIDTLSELLKPETPPPQRLGAAKTILETSAKLFEDREIVRRIEALEAAQGKTENRAQ